LANKLQNFITFDVKNAQNLLEKTHKTTLETTSEVAHEIPYKMTSETAHHSVNGNGFTCLAYFGNATQLR
jgi:hypothetical protein